MHLEEAGAMLVRRDEALLRDKGGALCAKVRTTRHTRGEPSPSPYPYPYPYP